MSTAVATLDTEVEQWHSAYEMVVLNGYSHRRAAEKLGVTHPTVKAWVGKYQQVLIDTRGDKAQHIADMEAMLLQTAMQAQALHNDAVAKGKELVAVAALNTRISALDRLIKVRGLEAPKEDKTKHEGKIEIVWSGSQSNVPERELIEGQYREVSE